MLRIKMKKNTIFALSLVFGIVAILISTALPARAQPICGYTLQEILDELTQASTQKKAETAIRHLFDTTGIGTSCPGSKYGAYVLDDDKISELAEAHLRYLNDKSISITIGQLYDAFATFSEDYGKEYISLIDLDIALNEFQNQAILALAEPGNPNNALLIVIIAEGSMIPNSIPIYDSATPLSPLQVFLFGLWFSKEYSFPNTQPSNLSGLSGYVSVLVSRTVCIAACTAVYVAAVAACALLAPEAMSVCLSAGSAALSVCIALCPPATVIKLSSFEAIPGNNKITLKWPTESEIDNAGFNLCRSEKEGGEYTKINTTLIPGKGSSTQGAAYEFVDTDVQNRKTYYYKLEDIDLAGISTRHGPVNAMPRWIYGNK